MQGLFKYSIKPLESPERPVFPTLKKKSYRKMKKLKESKLGINLMNNFLENEQQYLRRIKKARQSLLERKRKDRYFTIQDKRVATEPLDEKIENQIQSIEKDFRKNKSVYKVDLIFDPVKSKSTKKSTQKPKEMKSARKFLETQKDKPKRHKTIEKQTHSQPKIKLVVKNRKPVLKEKHLRSDMYKAVERQEKQPKRNILEMLRNQRQKHIENIKRLKEEEEFYLDRWQSIDIHDFQMDN